MKPFELPPAPPTEKGLVKAWRQNVVIPTYEVLPADKNPMFLEKRVYQGSSGRVYPLPFHDRIAERPVDREWDALHIENEFIRVMVLPQLGGRIHVALDKTNGYDFIYRQNVIKPALVGLAGPWISGGIEFNWPQHHRPATYMPVDSAIESHEDGSRTLWLSDHDPMSRMKGMHGICLHPGRSVIEIKVRLYNRTPFTQTFLWWTNIAVRVNEHYQSFFPSDVTQVADHARRASSTFPLCQEHYYGVDYGARGQSGVPSDELPAKYRPLAEEYAANDLSWYANIPVPTSYMCVGTDGDFLGGYDHAARSGIVHVANHHISPGKKQWTWGNHDFGYAWDRNLTDPAGDGEHAPYIELMAGVYTDNQPDFSFLSPGETKAFSQFIYPLREIGPVQAANERAAISVSLKQGEVSVGVLATSTLADATLQLSIGGRLVRSWVAGIHPGAPFKATISVPQDTRLDDVELLVNDAGGVFVIGFEPAASKPTAPAPATEIPLPADIASTDELYLSGVHLSQYRHATRKPEAYWQETLARDPDDSRCNTAMGIWRMGRAEFYLAEAHFRRAIARLTRRNANPSDGEAFYHLGLLFHIQGKSDDAYDHLYKATWNSAWKAAGFYALAQIDCQRSDWAAALSHLDQSLRNDSDHLAARNLKVIVLRRLGQNDQATRLLDETRALDPLDWMAANLAGDTLRCNTQTQIDLAIDLMRSGVWSDAKDILGGAAESPDAGCGPLVHYFLGYANDATGDAAAANQHYSRARSIAADYCFPSRLEDAIVLDHAIQRDPEDAQAHFLLGNLFYDRQRYAEATAHWKSAITLDPRNPIAWRNLGIAYFNTKSDPSSAMAAYAAAIAINPDDARLLYEQDQLAKRIGVQPAERLQALEKRVHLVRQRDDLSIEYCALLNQTFHHAKALQWLQSRSFQPWEGGEGLALGQHVRTHVALAKLALRNRNVALAINLLRSAKQSPANLGEAKHLVANQSDLDYWMGEAFAADGNLVAAKAAWESAARKRGDFVGMAIQPYSEMTYFTILALRKLGRQAEAHALHHGLQNYATMRLESPASIDYFATSLPTMLLFNEDIERTKNASANMMLAQTSALAGEVQKAMDMLRSILTEHPHHAAAAELLADLDHPLHTDAR